MSKVSSRQDKEDAREARRIGNFIANESTEGSHIDVNYEAHQPSAHRV